MTIAMPIRKAANFLTTATISAALISHQPTRCDYLDAARLGWHELHDEWLE
jgi:hypothetical protein